MEEDDYFIDDSEKERLESTLGSKLLFVMHLACGQHLQMPTPRWTVWKMPVTLYGVLIFLGVSTFLSITASILLENLHDFDNAVMLTAGFFGFLQCFLRIVYTSIRKRKIEQIAGRVHRALNRHALDENSADFNRKLSRIITAVLLIWTASFAVAMMSIVSDNLGAVDQVLAFLASNESARSEMRVTERLTFNTTLASTKLVQRLGVRPSEAVVRSIMAALLASSYVAIGRLIVSDVLFCSWYAVLVHQLQQLANCLPAAISSGGKKLKYWAHYHTTLNELLKEINAFTAPIVLVAVVFTGVKISIGSFVVFKLHESTMIVPFIAFGIASLLQVFFYCVLGQALQSKMENLNAEAYKCSWLEGSEGRQGAALMICLTGNEKSGCKLPGAPFFPMSLQFFVSMVSVVFTYFIVLLQLS